jgi:hypothetical protein
MKPTIRTLFGGVLARINWPTAIAPRPAEDRPIVAGDDARGR